MFSRWLAPFGGLLALTLLAGEPSVKAEFVGGTLPGVKAKATAWLDITDPSTLTFLCGKTALRIPYPKINTLEYGQRVSRRYVAAVLISPVLLLSKSRRHYITLGYIDQQDRQQALVFRIDKGDIRSVLAGLEARTGRRVEFQDDDARKAGQ
jgi:hypothetical protein